MLMAVEMWMKRDHAAEWTRWTGWLDHIAERVSAVDGVTTLVVQPKGLSNKTPSLKVLWDREGSARPETPWRGRSSRATRASQFSRRADRMQTRTGLSITPYMLAPGEEKIVADRLYAVLTNPPKEEAPAPRRAADVTGLWDVRIEYAAGDRPTRLHLRQRGNDIDGLHQGDFVSRDLRAPSTATPSNAQRVRRIARRRAQLYLHGTVAGDEMSGTLDMGEYRRRAWTGTAHAAERWCLMATSSMRDRPGVSACLGRSSPLSGSRSAAEPKYDLLLRGGHVIDRRTARAPCATWPLPAARSPRCAADRSGDAFKIGRRRPGSTSRPA